MYHQKQSPYYPKRPLHSFQDLEVYQKTLECSVAVAKEITAAEVAVSLPKLRSVEAKSSKGHAAKAAGNIGTGTDNIGSGTRGRGLTGTGSMHSTSDNFGSGTVRELIIKNMLPCALGIPHQVAEAHSLRFGDHTAGIAAIEKAMLSCNKMVVYLEQLRDICDTGISWEFFDETIKKYVYVRRKMLRLEQAWKKFMPGFKKAE